MTRRARTDLRDRMQRVAAKPAAHPDTPKRTRATATRRAPAARRRAPVRVELDADIEADVEPDADAGVAADPMPMSRSRLDTLVAWAQWELMSVPRERFHYLRRFLSGDGASGHDED